MFLEISMQLYSVVFALSRQINKQIDTKTVNLLYADNKVFATYQTQGVLTPTPPCVRPCPHTLINQSTWK